jgi:hypothetical protein
MNVEDVKYSLLNSSDGKVLLCHLPLPPVLQQLVHKLQEGVPQLVSCHPMVCRKKFLSEVFRTDQMIPLADSSINTRHI